MANKKMSTAELVGISHFSRNGLMTQRYGEVVYFIVQPTNISVLSETSIAIKINHLMQLLSQQPDIEIICSDARENFEFNKLALARKAEKEDNLKVQLLLRRDMKFLDDIQLQMSTAREFMTETVYFLSLSFKASAPCRTSCFVTKTPPFLDLL